MKHLLHDLDPLFMAAAVMVACLTAIAYLPEAPLMLDHPPLDLSGPDSASGLP